MLTISLLTPAQVFGGPLANWTAVALIVIAAAIVAMAVMGGILFVRFNLILSELRRAAHHSFGPVSDRVRTISDNVEYVTQALRTDVERLNASVRALGDRLQQASDHMEERIDEFNALMEVVQGEAEELFLDTASTVRGVREGARAIASPPRAPSSAPTEPSTPPSRARAADEGVPPARTAEEGVPLTAED